MTQRSTPAKVSKAKPTLTLWKHPSGRWCKKVRGRFCYFGKIEGDEDGTKAQARWEAAKDDLYAGRTPRPATAAGAETTVGDLCNAFLNSKRRMVEAGRMKPRSHIDYKAACERIIAQFGKYRAVSDLRPADFEAFAATLAKGYAVRTLLGEMTRVSSVFKYAYDSDMIQRPVKFGPGWRKPSKAELRKARASRAPRMFEAEEIRTLLDAANPAMKAAILLGVNAALGNEDIATLRETHLDLAAGWIDFPRPKTGIHRRLPLWPETVAALREAMDSRSKRRKPEADGDRVFLSTWGRPLNCDYTGDGKTRTVSGICQPFRALMEKTGLYRKGRGFYSFRHVLQTIGDDARDPVATKALMGHIDGSMSGEYRERISDDRLRAVVDHVRGWLFEAKTPVAGVEEAGRNGLKVIG